jgi:hypothetical protein
LDHGGQNIISFPVLVTRVGKYCLLVLDGHGNDLTPEFDQACEENQIIALGMPRHASHLSNLGMWVVSRFWSDFMEDRSQPLMRNGVNVIDKENFLELIAARKNLLPRSETQKRYRIILIAPAGRSAESHRA